jgi:hypothetical protein
VNVRNILDRGPILGRPNAIAAPIALPVGRRWEVLVFAACRA